ncbi:hypothetical protein Patl1_35224 [Pistacia atlantica]|uniref:Uncharacterized protein n=1 Tax=Pistacia atlantica TaxID=434234 RepID=A0ACC0ZWH1_9ROSI|nr:hypothetical protein Patl1_35224 [Pistacia atlantica]
MMKNDPCMTGMERLDLKVLVWAWGSPFDLFESLFEGMGGMGGMAEQLMDRMNITALSTSLSKSKADDKYNLKNPAVKRILQEVKEMKSNPLDDFMSLPLEENIFEWQFAIRGPCDTESEGGIYHGRIQLPAEYPFKPPSFILLTPNGRFETQIKICFSISNHREVIHEYMSSKRPPVPQFSPLECSEDHPGKREEIQEVPADANPGLTVARASQEAPAKANPSPSGVRASREIYASGSIDNLLPPRAEMRVQKPVDDRLFTWAAGGLTIAILVLSLKKFMKSSDHGAVFMDGS